MTTITTPTSADASQGGNAELAHEFAPPPKTRRSPLVVAVSVAAIALGGVASVLLFQSGSDAVEVVAVRTTVERGQVVEAADLMTVRITVDPALHPIAAAAANTVIGKRAALDLVAGGVVTAEQVTDTAVPAEGMSVVGLNLSPAMLPAQQVRVGDQVRVVTTSGAVPGAATTGTVPETVTGEVVGIAHDDVSGNTILNVQVSHDDAPEVADKAAAGRVAVILDSVEGN